ncbi:MAG: hypothetical protein VX589_18625 [Myxococcota bacterium]|nr:hypothetical protein [Myxococcota bacterium]
MRRRVIHQCIEPCWRNTMLPAALAVMALVGFSGAHAFELKPNPVSDEAYGESYTAIADLKDGSYVLTQFVFTNAGFGDGKAACRGLVVRAGGQGVNDAKRFDKDEWQYVSNGNVLKVGECALASKNGQTTFSVKTEKLTIDLLVEASAKAVKPPHHRVTVGDDEFYTSEVLIPWAKVTASVKTPAGKIVSTGQAYLDHTRSNTRLPKVAKKWLRFRGFHGARPCLLALRFPPKAGALKGWIWTGRAGGPMGVKATDVSIDDTRSSPSVKVKTTAGVLASKTTSVVYRYRPAKEWGLLGRLAKPWVGDPETSTFKATLTWPDGTQTHGILERAAIEDD